MVRTKPTIAVIAMTAILVSIPGTSAVESEELLIGYQSLGASTLVESSHEVELLRWAAISELISKNIPTERATEFENALPGLQAAASIFDRNPDSLTKLNRSLTELEAYVATPSPYSEQNETAYWNNIQQLAVDEVIADSLTVFGIRESSQIGIDALRIGLAADELSNKPTNLRIQAFLDAELARLNDDLAKARNMQESADKLRTSPISKLAITRLPALHVAKDDYQSAAVIFERHGEKDNQNLANLEVASIELELAESLGAWRLQFFAIVTISTILWGIAVWRYAKWQSEYNSTCQASFLLAVPK